MVQPEKIPSQHELESLMEPPVYENGSSVPQAQGPSMNQKQKVRVKFKLCTKFQVTDYSAEFWMAPSTTLQEACEIANRKLVRDFETSNSNVDRKLVRTIRKWMTVGTSQNHCNIVFVRPRMLVGDLYQTVGETISEDGSLIMSNTIDCFQLEDRSDLMMVGLIILGVGILILVMVFVCSLFA